MNEDKIKELKETIALATKQIEDLEKPKVWEPKKWSHSLGGDFIIQSYACDSYATAGMAGSREELEDRAKMLRANALIHAYICEKGTLNAGNWIVIAYKDKPMAVSVVGEVLLDTQTDEATAKELARKINDGEVVL